MTKVVNPRNAIFAGQLAPAGVTRLEVDPCCPEFRRRTFWQWLTRKPASRIAFILEMDTWTLNR